MTQVECAVFTDERRVFFFSRTPRAVLLSVAAIIQSEDKTVSRCGGLTCLVGHIVRQEMKQQIADPRDDSETEIDIKYIIR